MLILSIRIRSPKQTSDFHGRSLKLINYTLLYAQLPSPVISYYDSWAYYLSDLVLNLFISFIDGQLDTVIHFSFYLASVTLLRPHQINLWTRKYTLYLNSYTWIGFPSWPITLLYLLHSLPHHWPLECKFCLLFSYESHLLVLKIFLLSLYFKFPS